MNTELVVNIIIGLLSMSAVAVSLYTYFKSKREQSYSDIDTLYFEFLKLGLEYPKFRNPKYTSNYKDKFLNDDEVNKYEIYAFIAWNICETIFDRKDEVLFETWKPVIQAENKLHREWFDANENHHKFKEIFRTYIQKNFSCK